MPLTRPTLYLAITNHGFGHATRAASIGAAIQRLNPDILLILVTTAPRWLLDAYIPGDFIHRPRMLDVGVIQTDSLKMDKRATLEKLQHLQQRAKTIIAGEVSFIEQNRVGLVLGDIPPLAAPIARAAGIPGWMSSNFGWDFIYRSWGEDFHPIADWMAECFNQCDRLFRLPFHEPMSAFPVMEEVGLTGGTPRHTPEQLHQLFASWGYHRWVPKEKTVLITFGGLSLQQIPYTNLLAFPDWQFISFDTNAPDLPNLIKLSGHAIRPVDVMPICGRLISKPGYGTFAEACRNKLPVVTLTREDFAESQFLLEGIQQYGFHQILSPADFFNSHWDFLRQPLCHPQSTTQLPDHGEFTIAEAVVNFFA